jgi:proteic killer suppression protein
MEIKDSELNAYYYHQGARPNYVPPDVATRLVTKLDLLNAAASINDLQVPPSNRLEKLLGKRKGQYSIRVNDQYRLVFTWSEKEGASDVEFIDYH